MNIKVVAKRAGVSTATVSRTINGSDKVSPRTAEKVRRAIAALNFYPNTNARALGSGRTNLYGLIISDITNPFFPELVKAFEDVAVAYGQEVLVANTNYDPKRMEHCVTQMLQRKVDGLAIMTSEVDERIRDTVTQRGIPIVFMDLPTHSPGASSVRMDYADGVRQALEYLVSLGHRRIAFLSGPQQLDSARVRLEAFRKFMKLHKLAPVAIEEGDHHVEGGRAAMQRILVAQQKGQAMPSAVFASNDLTAIGALGALHDAGIHVPREISLVGFDDIQLSAYTWPALTTLRVSRTEIAEAAFQALYRARQGQGIIGEEHIIRPSLVLRQSAAALTGSRRQKSQP